MPNANKSIHPDALSPRAGRVEAILLSPDPEEGAIGTSELWRQAKGDRKSVIRNSVPTRIRENPAGSIAGASGGGKVATLKGILKGNKSASAGWRIEARSVSNASIPESMLEEEGADGFLERVTRFRQSSALRKSQSVSDIRRSSFPDLSSGRRRMSVSVVRPSGESSRRSSMASITISLSRPDSLDSHILYEPSNEPEFGPNPNPASGVLGRSSLKEPSRDFVRIRQTATTVRGAARFRPPVIRYWNSDGNHSRRNSCPGGVLDLWSKTVPIPAERRNSNCPEWTPTNPGGMYLPASRPPSARLSSGMSPSRRSSIVSQLGNVSRPWTPTSASPQSSGRNSSLRFPFAIRPPTLSLAAPLQALNQKVRNILGCTTNILDFYSRRDSISRKSSIRTENFLKQSAKNDRKTHKVSPLPFSTPAGGIGAKNPSAGIKNSSAPPFKNPARRNVIPPPKIPKVKETATSKISSAWKKPPVKSELPPEIPPHPPTPEAIPAPGTKKSRWAVFTRAPDPEGSTSKAPAGSLFSRLKSLTRNSGSGQKPKVVSTVLKTLKIPKYERVQAKYRATKNNSGANASGGGSGGVTSSSSPAVTSLVQSLLRQRGGDRGKKRDFQPVVKLEQYTDKDRAAAVLLGDTDIKTTLEKQLKTDRGRYVMPKESPAQVYQAQADFEMRIGGLATAHRLLDKALELLPGDKNALVSRSRCRLLLGDTKGALEDAEEALRIDQQFVKATYQKAEVLFQVGRFEEALVFYHTGVKQRPDMEVFHQGVRKAQEAIEVSLGVKQQSQQQVHQHRRTAIVRKKNSKKTSEQDPRPSLPPLNLNRITNSSLNGGMKSRRTSSSARDSSLLGDLHVDKIYLEKLLDNPGLRNANGSSLKILNHARETLDYLKSREDFWRQQQPTTIVYPRTKEKIKKTKKKRRLVAPTSRTTLSSSSEVSGSVSSEFTSPDDSDSVKSTQINRLGNDNSGSQQHLMRRDSSTEISALLVNSRVLLTDQLKRIVKEMTECKEENLLNKCAQIYLSTYWEKLNDSQLSEEIETRIKRLQLLASQEEEAARKTNLKLDIATLHLANGNEVLSKTSAEESLLLAVDTNNWQILVRVYLLMAAVAASSDDSPNVSANLSRAQELLETIHEDLDLSDQSN